MTPRCNALPFPILAVALAALTACADGSPVDLPPSGETHLTSGAAAGSRAVVDSRAAADVAGEWNWEKTEILRFPRWVVEQVINPLPGPDVEPEGPNTHARCSSGGTMTLTQDGDSFEGPMTTEFGGCVTRGGQSFLGPAAGLPQSLFDGRIRGSNLSFSVGNLVVTPCPLHAVITTSEGGVATAFNGGGHCLIPGHPHTGSVMDVDPPPGGTSVTSSFDAWRE